MFHLANNSTMTSLAKVGVVSAESEVTPRKVTNSVHSSTIICNVLKKSTAHFETWQSLCQLDKKGSYAYFVFVFQSQAYYILSQKRICQKKYKKNTKKILSLELPSGLDVAGEWMKTPTEQVRSNLGKLSGSSILYIIKTIATTKWLKWSCWQASISRLKRSFLGTMLWEWNFTKYPRITNAIKEIEA